MKTWSTVKANVLCRLGESRRTGGIVEDVAKGVVISSPRVWFLPDEDVRPGDRLELLLDQSAIALSDVLEVKRVRRYADANRQFLEAEVAKFEGL